MRRIKRFTKTIASGTTTSAIDLDSMMLLAVNCPAGIASTTFTVQTSPDGVTYQTFYKDGANKSYACAASKNVSVADDHIIANFIKIVFGSSETDKTFDITALRMD